jgi:AcrR family transcriptional regulator
MTRKKPGGTAKAKAKPSRAERNEDVKRRLFLAAANIVGRDGYAEASVARITARAGVAQGTFYNHFANRQALLDQLLPAIGRTMLDFIQERVNGAADEGGREIERFRAFFDFLREVPEFPRILNEAEFFAPSGHAQHFATIVAGYLRILKRARAENAVADFSDDELEVLVHILLGARGYLGRRYAYVGNRVREVPEHVFSAYEKLLTHGIFGARAAPGRGPSPPATHHRATTRQRSTDDS